MLNRRIFISRLCAGGTMLMLGGCGGGGGSGTSAGPLTSGSAPAPTPAPAATPTPPPVPTLKGVTIDDAERTILAGMKTERDWFAETRTAQPVTVVRNADELQVAIDAAFDTTVNAQAIAINHRIVADWSGVSTLASGPTGRLVIGRKLLTDTHAARGGSVTIVAASGASPAIGNTAFISASGITIEGLGFARQAQDGENADAVSAVLFQQNSTYPVESMIRFRNCKFGALNFDSTVPASRFVNGVATSGTIIRYVAFEGCTFRGMQNGAKIVARGCEFELCDFRAVSQDGIDLFGHVHATGYYAYAAIRRTTFREWGDTLETRDVHSDAIQTGTSADKHLGYRVVLTDTVAHMTRRYGGSSGKGGGPQGFYNDDHVNADNQFVLRRNTFLVTSPHGFAYFSPKATQPSFVDQCTFMRSGTIPSVFAPDVANQDTTVVISGSEPAGGPWLSITNTLAKNGLTAPTAAINLTEVDPRMVDRAPAEQQPEAIFTGRDFGRGLAAVNSVPGKFGYALPNESSSQKRFVEDIWANYQPKSAFSGWGAPDPRGVGWAA